MEKLVMMSMGSRNFPNLRDLGGLATSDGRSLKHGVIYRSEALHMPDGADATMLDAFGIALVCDLRSRSERTLEPNDWWRQRNVTILELDIFANIQGLAEVWAALRDNPTALDGQATMQEIYRRVPAAAAAHLGTVFRHLVAGRVPLLIHCTAGKDRTGFLVAALLRALEIDQTAIMQDYLASGDHLHERVVEATRQLAKHHTGIDVPSDVLDELAGVHPAYIDASFAAIDAEYGSFSNYLVQSAHVDAPIIRRAQDLILS